MFQYRSHPIHNINMLLTNVRLTAHNRSILGCPFLVIVFVNNQLDLLGSSSWIYRMSTVNTITVSSLVSRLLRSVSDNIFRPVSQFLETFDKTWNRVFVPHICKCVLDLESPWGQCPELVIPMAAGLVSELVVPTVGTYWWRESRSSSTWEALAWFQDGDLNSPASIHASVV